MGCFTCEPANPARVWPFATGLPGIELFSCDFLSAEEALKIRGARPMLSDARQSRQHEFGAGRACAIAALRALGSTNHAVRVAHPYRYPLFPDGFVGSISHTGSLAIACAANAKDYLALGLDIEVIESLPEVFDLVSHVMTDFEIEKLNGCDDEEKILSFYLCFSAKESFFKAMFPLSHAWMEFTEAQILSRDELGNFELQLVSSAISSFFPGNTIFTGTWAIWKGCMITLLPLSRGVSGRLRSGGPLASQGTALKSRSNSQTS